MSPQTVHLKTWIKLPMVLLIVCSSMMSSTSMVMLKMLGELLQSASWTDYWLLNLIMVTLLGVSGAL